MVTDIRYTTMVRYMLIMLRLMNVFVLLPICKIKENKMTTLFIVMMWVITICGMYMFTYVIGNVGFWAFAQVFGKIGRAHV